MDNGRASLPSISGKREYKSVLLSYRIYKRLSHEEQVKYNLLSLNYTPLVGSLALYLYKYYGGRVVMQKVLFIKAERDMIDIFDEAQMKFMGYLPKDIFIKKALIFQGFVPESSIKMRKQYAYIMTNRMVENEYWVFNSRFSDNYKTSLKGKYQSYTEVFGRVGIPGITKIKYSYE